MNGSDNSLLGWIQGLGETATGILGALKKGNTTKPVTTSTATKTTTPTWLWPVVIIGGALVLLLVLVPLLRRS